MLKRTPFTDPIFLLAVILPTAIAALYFGLLASDIYISETRFVVRSPEKQATSALGLVLGSAGLVNSGDKSYTVVEYIRSRDALRDSNRDGAIEKAYTHGNLSLFDRFGSFANGSTFEHFYAYFSNKVGIDFDAGSQVTRLSVSAFTPRDAQMINQRLLAHAEQLVNRLNARAQKDTIQLAQAEVDRAKDRARAAATALGQFRNAHRIIDPEKEAVVRLQMISKLQDELIGARTQLAQMRQYTPENPQIPTLRTQIAALGKEIADQTGQIAGAPNSLSGDAVKYQALQLDAEVASKQLAAALASVQDAESEARRKQAYVERIAEPNLPDYPLEPHRWKAILATFVLGLIAWGVLRTLIAGIREHHD